MRPRTLSWESVVTGKSNSIVSSVFSHNTSHSGVNAVENGCTSEHRLIACSGMWPSQKLIVKDTLRPVAWLLLPLKTDSAII